MTEGEAISAPQRLLWIAKASIVLGIVTAIRLVPEVVILVPRGLGGIYYLLLALDLLWAGLWIQCGLVLRKQPRPAIRFAAVGGALILGHALASAFLLGRDFLKNNSGVRPSNYDLLLAFYASRMLIYVIEVVFWACALLVLLQQAQDSDRGRRRSVLIAIIGTFLAGAVLQTILVVAIFGW